jgi:hypothetical protein
VLKFRNEVYVTGKFPDEWRNGIVILIFKREDKKNLKKLQRNKPTEHMLQNVLKNFKQKLETVLKDLYLKPKIVFEEIVHALT